MRRWAARIVVAGMMALASGEGVVLAGTASVTGIGGWAGKVYEYANCFDPNLDRNASETTITQSAGWSTSGLADIVNRVDGRDAINGGGRLSQGGHAAPPGPSAYVEFAPSASFFAGTVIGSQNVWNGFSGSMPSAVKFGTGASPAWSSIAPLLSDPGAPGSEAIRIANTLYSYDRVRIEYDESAISGGTAYADYNNLIVLPERMARIETVTATATSTTWGSPANLVNMTNNSGWAKHTGLPDNVSVTFLMNGGEKDWVGGIVFYSYENVGVSFTLRDAAGGAIADITMTTGPYGWSLPIRFDYPLYTTELTADFGYVTQQVALREVLFLRPIPEPGLALLAGVSTVCLIAQRSRARAL